MEFIDIEDKKQIGSEILPSSQFYFQYPISNQTQIGKHSYLNKSESSFDHETRVLVKQK